MKRAEDRCQDRCVATLERHGEVVNLVFGCVADSLRSMLSVSGMPYHIGIVTHSHLEAAKYKHCRICCPICRPLSSSTGAVGIRALLKDTLAVVIRTFHLPNPDLSCWFTGLKQAKRPSPPHLNLICRQDLAISVSTAG